MKAIMLPAIPIALANSAPPELRASIHTSRRRQISSGRIVMVIRADRQNDTSHAGRSICRTRRPPVLNTTAAVMAQAAPTALELSP